MKFEQMMNSSPEDFTDYLARDRQSRFEDRVVEKIFKFAKYHINTIKVMRNKNGGVLNSEMLEEDDLAVRFLGVHVLVRKMSRAMSFMLELKKLKRKPDTSKILTSLIDFQEAYPNELIAVIMKFTDFADDFIWFLDRDVDINFKVVFKVEYEGAEHFIVCASLDDYLKSRGEYDGTSIR